MTIAKRARLAAGLTTVIMTTASCNIGECLSSAEIAPLVMMTPAGTMWVGDTHQFTAIRGIDCKRAVSSRNDPGGFVFTSTAPEVATVSAHGLVTALSPGVTQIRVERSGMVESRQVVVGDPVATIAISFSPTQPKAGDEITATISPLRADGTAAQGAEIEGNSYLIINGTTLAGSPFTGSTFKFIAIARMLHSVTARAVRMSGPSVSGTANVGVP